MKNVIRIGAKVKINTDGIEKGRFVRPVSGSGGVVLGSKFHPESLRKLYLVRFPPGTVDQEGMTWEQTVGAYFYADELDHVDNGPWYMCREGHIEPNFLVEPFRWSENGHDLHFLCVNGCGSIELAETYSKPTANDQHGKWKMFMYLGKED
jgi:hypothetical protein